LVASVLTGQINSTLLQYFCSNCNTLLKETYESVDNSRFLINPAEECPTCGCLLSKTLTRELKSEQKKQQLLLQKQNSIQGQQSTSSSPLPKFQTAYEQFGCRLTFDIKKIDDCIRPRIGERICIIGERKYTKVLLARLCVRALLPKRHGGDAGDGFESSNVIVIDAGNSLDVYQHVNFARQYGLDIKKVLQHIIISRVFTIYQLANIIVYELPKIIDQYDDDTKLIVIYDLLDMFLRDPQLEVEEGQRLIKEIMTTLKQRREIFGNILIVTSLSSYHNYCHQSSSSSAPYYKIILPRFDKHIEIMTTTTGSTNKKKISTTSLEGKVKDNSKGRLHSKHYNSNSSHSCVFPIEERDLLLVTPR
jgi:hypothetical protein